MFWKQDGNTYKALAYSIAYWNDKQGRPTFCLTHLGKAVSIRDTLEEAQRDAQKHLDRQTKLQYSKRERERQYQHEYYLKRTKPLRQAKRLGPCNSPCN